MANFEPRPMRPGAGSGTRPGACTSRARRRPAGRSSRARRWPGSNRRRSRSRRSRSGQPTARPAVAARSMPRAADQRPAPVDHLALDVDSAMVATAEIGVHGRDQKLGQQAARGARAVHPSRRSGRHRLVAGRARFRLGGLAIGRAVRPAARPSRARRRPASHELGPANPAALRGPGLAGRPAEGRRRGRRPGPTRRARRLALGVQELGTAEPPPERWHLSTGGGTRRPPARR